MHAGEPAKTFVATVRNTNEIADVRYRRALVKRRAVAMRLSVRGEQFVVARETISF